MADLGIYLTLVFQQFVARSMLFRLTQKLAKKIKRSDLSEQPPHENPYADWSAHLFGVGRSQYIILCNTKSLYSCVMPGKGATNENAFIERALRAIQDLMSADGLQADFEQFIAPSKIPVSFAKALNRSITGSMNELILAAQDALERGEVSLIDVGLDLNDYLLSAIAENHSQAYGKPREAFMRFRRGEIGPTQSDLR